MQENLFCFGFFLQMLCAGIIIVCRKKEIQHKNEFYNWVVKKKSLIMFFIKFGWQGLGSEVNCQIRFSFTTLQFLIIFREMGYFAFTSRFSVVK